MMQVRTLHDIFYYIWFLCAEGGENMPMRYIDIYLFIYFFVFFFSSKWGPKLSRSKKDTMVKSVNWIHTSSITSKQHFVFLNESE